MGELQHALQAGEFALIHAQFLRAEQRLVLAQETHDDRLAVEHGDDRDADVHLGGVDPHLDAAVLGQALFRDVQMAEDLDAGADRRLEPLHLGRHGNFLEDAVDAVPDPELVLEGLEMDVRGAEIDRVFQDLVDEANDRGVFGRVIEIRVADSGVVVEDLQAAGFVEGVDRVGADAQALLQFPLHDLRRREHRPEAEPRERPQAVQPLGREQPAGRDLDLVVDPPERQELIPQQEPGGEERKDLLVRLQFVERGVADAVFMGEPA